MMNGVTGIILAGGLGRRMGRLDKGLQPLRGKPMAQWVTERLAPQVDELLINCNQNLEAYARFGYRLVPDEVGGFAGPLAGLHAGLKAASHRLVVTVPCDSPFLPHDLVRRLKEHIGAHHIAVAKTGEQAHPVFSLVTKDVLENLERFLAAGGRKVDAWYAGVRAVEVSFDDEADGFMNINTLEELGRA
jgi:molybdopterin-guanine dinucleotide biosynthesis protein A